MEKDQNTAHETVEEKIAKSAVEESAKSDKPESDRVKETDKDTAVKSENEPEKKVSAKTEDKAEAQNKEDLTEADMIDINKEENKPQKTEAKTASKKNNKATSEFIAKQKKRKRVRTLVILAIVFIAIGGLALFIKGKFDKAKKLLEDMQANNYQTATVERKTLYDTKNATGTLYSLESRTLTRSLKESGGGAKIETINVEVGDHVSVGDVLVQFSKENIEKSISEAKEDIGTQRKIDAITAEDAQRNYVNSYYDVATNIQDSAEKVERALKNLHEACDAYGDAKRKREEIEENDELSESEKKLRLESAENAVASALKAQEQAQQAYDDAVEAQAKSISDGQGKSLSNADSEYKKSQINSGETVKKLQRQLQDSIDSLDDYVVYATINGVVTEVNVSEGNTFTSGNVLTIQDDSGYKAEVLIDEYDIPKIKKAYTEAQKNGKELEVVVKTEATEDNEYKGHVTQIAPTSTATAKIDNSSSGSSGGTSSSGSSSVNYKVSVELDEVDDAFMIGMSAKVAIVVNKAENALCIPYNAIDEKDDGTFAVRVMDEKADGGGPGGNDDSVKRVNGIVVENDSDSKESDNKGDKKDKLKDGLFSAFGKDNADIPEVNQGPKYREVAVKKLFETDFYVAVEPVVPEGLNEGDTVMIIEDSDTGNDIMAMFGGGGARNDRPMP